MDGAQGRSRKEGESQKTLPNFDFIHKIVTNNVQPCRSKRWVNRNMLFEMDKIPWK
jgi:hypothetical protein